MKFFPSIGLEIHIELKTKTKMFCSCKNDSQERHPNLNVCPICLGHPGVLPTINEEAIKKAIKVGLALNCHIANFSKFERKNYFYPDLPKGYQISQYQTPLCKNGFLEIRGKTIRIKRIHLEEDTGRLLHLKHYSLVDFNRAGIPLLELVTEPDLRSPDEAQEFAKELQLILRYLQVSDADMEKGQMRIETNVSLAKKEGQLGTKVEIKNLNSFSALKEALNYEIERQSRILEKGEKVIQETRGWDDLKKKTFSQREKEEEKDYRYFPEPDLPPLQMKKEFLEEIKKEIPELPQQKRKRFKREYELDEKTIEILVKNRDLSEYFEKIISEFDPNLPKEKLSRLIKLTSNYLVSDLLGLLKGAPFSEDEILITPENFAELISLVCEGKISSKIAKVVLTEMFSSGADPSQIIEERGLVQISSEQEIEKIAKEVILKNQKAVADYKKGKKAALQFLIGQAMAKTKGKANPELVKKALERLLESSVF